MTSVAPQPVLGIVPARGGSKGIVGKNMRLLAGKPLIAHTLDAVTSSGVVDRVVVSSDSEEILRWAEIHGYEALARAADLSGDDATIAAVAKGVAESLDWHGIVAVFQPTSPLRSFDSIQRAIKYFNNSGADSLMTVIRERHLFWFDESEDITSPKPLFSARLNRQYAKHGVLKETGAIQLVRAESLRACAEMVSENHVLLELPEDESIDIDTFDDLEATRRRLEQGTIVFRLTANANVGSGHLYHCLQLAEELADQRLAFLLRDCDQFAVDIVAERGYHHRIETALVGDLAALAEDGPRLVVNDILDTSEHDVLVERDAGFAVVNIEDLGPGARFADWVVNALYPATAQSHDHASHGARFATLRREFHGLPPKTINERPKRLLLTFGGTDPSGLAPRFAAELRSHLDLGIQIDVIVGPGAPEAAFPEGVTMKRHVRSMASEMLDADIVITSAGRTVYEAAVTGTPVVVAAQNAREATHEHLGYESGVVFVGIGPLVDGGTLSAVVRQLLEDHRLRAELSARLQASIDTKGAERIAHHIRALMRGL